MGKNEGGSMRVGDEKVMVGGEKKSRVGLGWLGSALALFGNSACHVIASLKCA